MAFFDNIKFPFFTMQELNLDWLLKEVKRIAGFMPQDGNVGDVLTRKSDGAEWEPPDAVNININALPEDTAITDNDQLVFYDISASANRKIKPPNLLDSMMSNGTPLMDGIASAGTSKKPARYDHRHPTDTSRQAALTGAQMNAVNSGAPAGCFVGGKLDINHGGTGGNPVALTTTYTAQAYITETDFTQGFIAYQYGKLIVIRVNAYFTSLPTGDFDAIGKINFTGTPTIKPIVNLFIGNLQEAAISIGADGTVSAYGANSGGGRMRDMIVMLLQ